MLQNSHVIDGDSGIGDEYIEGFCGLSVTDGSEGRYLT